MRRRNSGFRTPVRCLDAVRPGDRFTLAEPTGSFPKISPTALLARVVLAVGAMLSQWLV